MKTYYLIQDNSSGEWVGWNLDKTANRKWAISRAKRAQKMVQDLKKTRIRLLEVKEKVIPIR